MSLALANSAAAGAQPGQFWRVPSRAAARTYLAYAAIIGGLFLVGYGGANWLAAQGDQPSHLYLAAELAIPLIPAMIWVYLSINLLFVLPLFALDVNELHSLGRRMIAGTLIAVAIFVLVPTTLGFSRLDPSAQANPTFVLLYMLDRPNNCLPSLHVTYSALLVAAIVRRRRLWQQVLLSAWLFLIVASTLLTHQHHLADIAAALLLAGGLQFAFKPRITPHLPEETGA